MNVSLMPKPKHQRLVLVALALIAVIAAGLIAVWALRNQANYFYLPEQMAEEPPAPGQPVRLGGMVKPGTLQTRDDGVTVDFVVTGNGASAVPVRFTGILPDLFVEGSGVVAEGSLGVDGTFMATNLLAKHDENYVPKELEELTAHNANDRAAARAAETTLGLD